MHEPLTPARVELRDGVPYSPEYGDVYHSADGGLAQAQHVFLAGNGLPARWAGRRQFTIVETGFGLGLNFLATRAAWRDDPQACAHLHFVSVEKHPLTRDDLARALSAFPALADAAGELLAAWPPLMEGFHRLHFAGGRVTLTLLLGDALRLLPRLAARADAFYLDGFAPDRNPDLWCDALCREIARLAAPDATAATWSVAAAVRERLAAAGFATEKRAGFGRKRDMLAGCRTSPAQPIPAHTQRQALVIGAGMAGACVANRLAERGWRVEVIERRGAPAQEASGNAAGVLLPLLNLSDTPGARLSRAALPYAVRHLARLGPPVRWQASGVLQLARDAEAQERFERLIEKLAPPQSFVRAVSQAEAGAIARHPVAAPGWWFPLGGWLDPRSAVAASLQQAGIATRLHADVASLSREDEHWVARDGAGREIARAPVAILAQAHAAKNIGLTAWLPLHAVRGQVSTLPARPGRDLPVPVCRRGYITPAIDGMHHLGATFDHDDDNELRAASHAENLAKLESMLPGFAADLDPARLAGRVAFRATTPDRLPVVGPIPDAEGRPLPGLHALTGLGARGLVWAPLAAELLAAQLEGEPLPVESTLANAVAPARFLKWTPRGRREADD